MNSKASLALSIWLAALSLSASCWASPSPSWACPDRFEDEIREAADRYLSPPVDWRLYKAQLCAESRLQPDAESSVGAKGVAQFMPATWRRISRAIGAPGASPHQVGPAIRAGALYMARLREKWSAPRPDADRHSLAMASYNAGFGNLLKAQRLAGGARLYAPIIDALPQVTGHHARETKGYVERIWRFYAWEVTGP